MTLSGITVLPAAAAPLCQVVSSQTERTGDRLTGGQCTQRICGPRTSALRVGTGDSCLTTPAATGVKEQQLRSLPAL